MRTNGDRPPCPRRPPELSSLLYLSPVARVALERQGEALSELPIIMVVEDDQLVQGLVEDALTEGGFEAAIAASGEEATTLLNGNGAEYRALVTDINLSGKLNGWDVARHAREIDANFPVVYMTGAAADQWPINGVPNSILLSKPFAPSQLVTALSQLLNAAPLTE